MKVKISISIDEEVLDDLEIYINSRNSKRKRTEKKTTLSSISNEAMKFFLDRKEIQADILKTKELISSLKEI